MTTWSIMPCGVTWPQQVKGGTYTLYLDDLVLWYFPLVI